MAARVRAPVRDRSKRGGSSYSRELLQRLARTLVHSGHSPTALQREFRDICSALKEPAKRWDPTQLRYFDDLPHVITLWHTDPQYLDARGAPLPLPLRGRGCSLHALIERVLPDEDPKSVVRSLTRLQGVRHRRGLYVPSGRYVTYPRDSARVHGLAALLRMLRTVERNVTGPRAGSLLERSAVNPSFPVSELPAFHQRAEKYADDFLSTMDAAMRRREARDHKGPRVRLGIGIVTFEEPVAKQKRPALRGPDRRRTNRSTRKGRR